MHLIAPSRELNMFAKRAIHKVYSGSRCHATKDCERDTGIQAGILQKARCRMQALMSPDCRQTETAGILRFGMRWHQIRAMPRRLV